MRGSVIGVWHSGWTTHVSGASLAKGAADCTFGVLFIWLGENVVVDSPYLDHPPTAAGLFAMD
ncbi:hypothetical protein BC939DRAFT_457781 [Gamsiella multidivaricata]|uniref:uncharacterized protein n=1 Tax=Gamsiella multidivaricata TaxID=101098 RepID=UPI00221EAAEF|nr:uncharacterized protein BC939DRAFT_457781 [Gamsiella multidivaricata]KAI7820578.1 hypothetical protein BC939DRAFT_457781 [Gamsiella multidivaricata]